MVRMPLPSGDLKDFQQVDVQPQTIFKISLNPSKYNSNHVFSRNSCPCMPTFFRVRGATQTYVELPSSVTRKVSHITFIRFRMYNLVSINTIITAQQKFSWLGSS